MDPLSENSTVKVWSMSATLSSLTSALQGLTRLKLLDLVGLDLTGTLPVQWATGFPHLQVGGGGLGSICLCKAALVAPPCLISSHAHPCSR